MFSPSPVGRSSGCPPRNASFLLHSSSFCLQKMTLGRTSSGAIKIKTDSPGLRAVECGCCGELPCTQVRIIEPILGIMRNISSITCFGAPPDDFEIVGENFYASWLFGAETYYSCAFFGGTNSFEFTYDGGLMGSANLVGAGTLSANCLCGDFGGVGNCEQTVFTINTTQFPAVSVTYNSPPAAMPGFAVA